MDIDFRVAKFPLPVIAAVSWAAFNIAQQQTDQGFFLAEKHKSEGSGSQSRAAVPISKGTPSAPRGTDVQDQGLATKGKTQPSL